MSAVMTGYLDMIASRIKGLTDHAGPAMEAARDVIVEAVRGDHLVYMFGTGHSHMLTEEVHYRAGGPAFTVPILATTFMLHEGAIASTEAERTEGLVAPVFARYAISSDDVLFVISNSGINAAPVEAAHLGKSLGCTVIAITSIAYSTAAAKGRERIADIADITIDNGIPAGDALVDLPGSDLKAGPASTAVGAAILNAIFADVAHHLAEDASPPIYRSANMPGAQNINARLVAHYASRNRHL
ncbi:MAG: SIS domain-containing protein [Cohaesibacteraceae bacterium]